MARFVKESSLARAELLPDIDHMDLEARHETLHMKGEPVMVQISVVPCYAMTIHKTQLSFDPVLLFIYSSRLVGPPIRKVLLFEGHMIAAEASTEHSIHRPRMLGGRFCPGASLRS